MSVAEETFGKDPSDAFIQMWDIVKTFKTQAGEFTALKNVSVHLHRGEFVGVVGKSGSGKSTLVNMLTGIDHPTSGEVQIGGTLVHKLKESKMARWRGRNLGIVFQFYQLLPMLSLIENVMLPMDLSEMYSPSKREERAMDLLDRVGLAAVAHEMPANVSGGQQQSAAIARALANDPPLIVADEPTGNLDSRSAGTVFGIFGELAKQGKTIVMVTHDNALAERASRKLVIADGEIVNETVAIALPMLTHEQMLKATKHLEARTFAPGETIIRQGESNDAFYMIADGYTDVIVERGQGREVPVARLGPGEHFGEVELLHEGNRAIASIRATLQSAVRVRALGRQVFQELITEADAMRETLTLMVRQRTAENAMVQRPDRRSRYVETALA